MIVNANSSATFNPNQKSNNETCQCECKMIIVGILSHVF